MFGILADIFGRKITLIASIAGASVFSFVGAFVQNFWGYSILRLLTGIFAKGLFMITFLICVEVSGARYGATLGILFQVNKEFDTIRLDFYVIAFSPKRYHLPLEKWRLPSLLSLSNIGKHCK